VVSGSSTSRRGPVENLERHAASLGATLDAAVWWQGRDVDRLINAAHSALHEAVARLFVHLPGWSAVPEVSFSIYGERGVIDWLAWHPATRSLLVVELKTALVDVQAVLAPLDRYARLARRFARGAWVGADDDQRVAAVRGLVSEPSRRRGPSPGLRRGAARRWAHDPLLVEAPAGTD
jgi:hypothetical protein